MDINTRFERPTKAGSAIIPGLPILPHGVERHVVPGGGSRGIKIDEGDEITVVDREGLQMAEMVFFAPNGTSDANLHDLQQLFHHLHQFLFHDCHHQVQHDAQPHAEE
jgi:aminomethyltransferase